jgi:hypothetical protein
MKKNRINKNSSEYKELSLPFKSYSQNIPYFDDSKFSEDDKIPRDTNVYLNAKLQMFTSGRRLSLHSDPSKTLTNS